MNTRRGTAVAWLGGAILAAGLAAQQPLPPTLFGGPVNQQQQGIGGALAPRGVVAEGQQWVRELPPAPFRGFPVFPSRLSGYGNNPNAALLQGLLQGQGMAGMGQIPGLSLPGLGGAAQIPGFGLFPGTGAQGLGNMPPIGMLPPGGDDALPLPPAEEESGWPSWASTRDREPLPFAEDLGLLVRHGDRVWWKAPEEDAYVPLYYHDKFRTVPVGSQVEVRQAGEFELLLHRSTRLVARGRTSVQLHEMNPERVVMTVHGLTRLALTATTREHIVQLPDGSRLQLPAAQAAAADNLDVLIERAVEPDWLGGRATIFNVGSSDVRWTTASGDVVIPPGHRVTFLLTPSRARIGPVLQIDGGRGELSGSSVVVRAGDAATVGWVGARFTLPAGSSVQFDPLQGEPFAPPRTDR